MSSAADSKLRDKNAEESWEIIENLALYDHEGWNDPRDFAKPVKAISIPKSTPKMPVRRLLDLEDQISYLLKGSRKTPKTSSTCVPQACAKVFDKNVIEPSELNVVEPIKLVDRKKEMEGETDDDLLIQSE
ncbi:hypothetical protein Tco_0240655 [Tanacetum coccineum]